MLLPLLSPCHILLLACIGHAYNSNDKKHLTDEERRLEQLVRTAASRCAEKHGASGRTFTNCVDEAVFPGKQRAQSDGPYYELLRNFSCAVEDAGTLPMSQLSLTLDVKYDACDSEHAATVPMARASRGEGFLSLHPDFVYGGEGFLPSGNDVATGEWLSATAAAERCASMPSCAGFTFEAEDSQGPAEVFFKSTASGQTKMKGWHTYRRKSEQTCSASSGARLTYQVDVVRQEPLVAIVRQFATRSECDALMDAGGDFDEMDRAWTTDGGPNPYRQSYSANIELDLSDSTNVITQLGFKMFAITRNLTGYAVYPPGQEPINAVLYKLTGDEYRPHCDGRCDEDGPYRAGERVATSILYCKTASEGGQTSFTEDSLKIVPSEGDLLLFAYLVNGSDLAGKKQEHSGCPLRKGTKWIATQWYRESVHEDWNWEDASNDLDEGI